MFELRKIEAAIRADLFKYLAERRTSKIPTDDQVAGIINRMRETLDRLGGMPPEFDIQTTHHSESRTLSCIVREKVKP